MDIKQYWALVRNERMKMRKTAAGQTLQPEQPLESELDGIVFITSLTNHERNTVEGSVCEVPTTLGAQRIVETTHKLSTDEEIAAYQAEHAIRRDEQLDEKIRSEKLSVHVGDMDAAREFMQGSKARTRRAKTTE